MARVALFGLPASGKGSLAQRMADRWGWPHLSTGDMIRRIRRLPGPLGDELRALPAGSFASDALVVSAVSAELADPRYAGGAVFDGFPRTLGQLDAMDRAGLSLDAALLLSAQESALTARALSRRVHVPSGRVYNVQSKPPRVPGLDDETGEPLSWREDDREDIVRARFADYWAKTDPVVAELRRRSESGRCRFVEIDAMGSAEYAWEAAKQALEGLGLAPRSRKPSG